MFLASRKRFDFQDNGRTKFIVSREHYEFPEQALAYAAVQAKDRAEQLAQQTGGEQA